MTQQGNQHIANTKNANLQHTRTQKHDTTSLQTTNYEMSTHPYEHKRQLFDFSKKRDRKTSLQNNPEMCTNNYTATIRTTQHNMKQQEIYNLSKTQK